MEKTLLSITLPVQDKKFASKLEHCLFCLFNNGLSFKKKTEVKKQKKTKQQILWNKVQFKQERQEFNSF